MNKNGGKRLAAALLGGALSLCCNGPAVAQVWPHDGDTVNYRLVGFSIPEQKRATCYELEITENVIDDHGDTVTMLVLDEYFDNNSMIATVPAWGTSYEWRVSCYRKGQLVYVSPGYHFTTGRSVFADTSAFRMRVHTGPEDNRNMYLLVDGTRSIHDMNGNAVWYLPGVADNDNVWDMRLTPDNTITFVTRTNAMEVDYNGKVLWQAPDDGQVSGDTTEHYHHAFVKMRNGHYMVAGSEFVKVPVTGEVDASLPMKYDHIVRLGGQMYAIAKCGTIIEYDHEGNVVWSWKSSGYFTEADLMSRRSVTDNLPDVRTHMNSFYLDERQQAIYTAYRDVNRIVKIAYPGGQVLAEYGEAYTPGRKMKGHGMFYGLHAPRTNSRGELYMFNNNKKYSSSAADTNQAAPSAVLVCKEPETAGGELEKVWEFTCDFDTLANHFSVGGGNVWELPNTDMLVCMGFSGRYFIVGRNKQVKWNAVVERRNDGGAWENSYGYRVHPIETGEQLQGLVRGNR